MADFPTWQHKYTSRRMCPTAGYGSNAQIKVEAGLHYLQGNDRPYFSVTADVKGSQGEAGGCMHTEIAKYWPKLAPIIALHLSTDQGEPMHAEANGWYSLAGYFGGAGERYHAGNSEKQIWKEDGTFDRVGFQTPEECLQSFAKHVRITVDDARALAGYWKSTIDDDPKSVRRWFGAWINTQRPRWQAEAEAGIKLLDELIAGSGGLDA